MSFYDNYTPNLVEAIQRGSALELIAHLESLRSDQVRIDRFHPLLAMLMTTLKPLKDDNDRTRRIFKPMTSEDIYTQLVLATEQQKLSRLSDILRHYMRMVSADMMRRQLAYHSWASSYLKDSKIDGSTLIPANREARVILPFSLLITPVKPVFYKSSSKLLNSAEITATFDWLRSMAIL